VQPGSGVGGLVEEEQPVALLAQAAVQHDVGEALEHYASRLHLDPENQLVQEVVYRASGIDRAHLKALGAGTFFYSALEGLEGVGLILRRRWAEYLTVLATGLLLPLEIYEIAQKVSAVRVAILLANLAILAYLIWRLREDHRGQAGVEIVTTRKGLAD